jgi:hypothetical protein
MKSIDLTKLIEGLLILILASIAIGKYGDLRAFAEREAAASLHGWGTHAFFPNTYRKIIGSEQGSRVQLKGAAHFKSPPRLVQSNFKSQEFYRKSE